MKAYRCLSSTVALLITAIALVCLTALSSASASAASSPRCSMRLMIELTPDVPNPEDPGFVSSLLSNQVGYQLKWVRPDNESVIVVDLSGPGPDDRCGEVIETMRHDARIVSIRVDPQETQSISVTGSREPADIRSSVRMSRAGLGSLYWAVQHPTQAWRIVLPIRPDSSARLYADAVQACNFKVDAIGTSTACP